MIHGSINIWTTASASSHGSISPGHTERHAGTFCLCASSTLEGNSLRQPIFTICTNRSDRLAADIWLTFRKDITYDQTLYEQMPKHTCR
jgi:hypothetical protein